MLKISHLTKKYGKVVACNDITLDVGNGEVAVLLGPNGAVKSTLIKSVAGKLRTRGYAFDIEILALCSRQKASIKEMPVRIDFKRGESFGRIRFRDIWKMFTDTIGIWWNLRVRKKYD